MAKIKGVKVLKIDRRLKEKTYDTVRVKNRKGKRFHLKDMFLSSKQVKSYAIRAQSRNSLKFVFAF